MIDDHIAYCVRGCGAPAVCDGDPIGVLAGDETEPDGYIGFELVCGAKACADLAR